MPRALFVFALCLLAATGAAWSRKVNPGAAAFLAKTLDDDYLDVRYIGLTPPPDPSAYEFCGMRTQEDVERAALREEVRQQARRLRRANGV